MVRVPGRLTSAFVDKLADDFETNGGAAIERCRKDDPTGYLRLISSLATEEGQR